jgi:hypothetical protein
MENNMTIWKYELKPGTTKLYIPQFAEVLTVQIQDGVPQMWVLVDPTQSCVETIFRIIGTGEEFESDNLKYVATFQMSWMVWHVFEEKREQQ